jgi:hypothetical protein
MPRQVVARRTGIWVTSMCSSTEVLTSALRCAVDVFCRPTPDRYVETASADPGCSAVMHGDCGVIGNLLLPGFTPMLGAPGAGVGRVHTDDRDIATGGHPDQAVAELRGGDASHGAAKPFSLAAAAHAFPSGRARVGEVEVLHHHRCAVVLLGAMLAGSPTGLPAVSSTQHAR